jgi:acyl dehydratase
VSAALARTFTLTEERIQAYSRRGNFHSDAAQASALGLPGLVAQGVQVAGQAYGALLDTWGDDFLAHGEFECTFVGMVTEEQVVTTRVQIDDDGHASFEVVNDTTGKVVVVGSAALAGVPSS